MTMVISYLITMFMTPLPPLIIPRYFVFIAQLYYRFIATFRSNDVSGGQDADAICKWPTPPARVWLKSTANIRLRAHRGRIKGYSVHVSF